MKSLRSLFLCILLIAGIIMPGAAQVKQVYKVIDRISGKPLEGATTNLYGIQLKTNAKGVAVATLPAQYKGEYISEERWTFPGYTQLGSLGIYQKNIFQSSDTMFINMIPEEVFQQEVSSVFLNFFDKVMSYTGDNVRDYYQRVKDKPEFKEKFKNSMVDLDDGLNRWADLTLCNAISIVTITHNDLTMPDNIKRQLLDGELEEALKMAKEQMVPNNTDKENLERVARYLTISKLNHINEDTTNTIPLYRLLYEQNFGEDCAATYLAALSAQEEYDEWQRVCDIEKNRKHSPLDVAFFEPDPFMYEGEKMCERSEQTISILKETARQHPSNYFNQMISAFYPPLIYAYALSNDTLKALASIDSLLAYHDRYMESYNVGAFHKTIINIWDHSSPMKLIKDLKMPYLNNKEVELAAKSMKMAEDLYHSNPDNQMAEILYAFKTYDLYKLYQDYNIEYESLTPLAEKINDILKKLLPKYPEYYAVPNMKVAADLYGECIFNNDKEESVVKSRYQDYHNSYETLEKLFPGIFYDNYMRFNTYAEAFLAGKDQSTGNQDLTEFTDELLREKAKKDNIPFEAAKAQHYNNIAEQLYIWEEYSAGILQYQKAIDYYKKAAAADQSMWIPYLANYLQMGDAYLLSKQYDEAKAAYRKILQEEPNIPADLMPQYLKMKGGAYWYEGDVCYAQNDAARGAKLYKTAEKWLKKSIAAGDSTALRYLGEIFFSKGARMFRQANLDKAYQLFDQSETYYSAYPLESPSNRYESLLQLMEEYYGEMNDVEQYVKVQGDKVKYYKQFTNMGSKYLSNYAESLRRMSTLSDDPTLKTQCNKELITSIEELSTYSSYDDGSLNLPYIQAHHALADAYLDVDSFEQAIPYYEKCLELGEYFYKDTSYARWQMNFIETAMPLAACYEEMADVDTSNRKQWFLKAIGIRDTLTHYMKSLIPTSVDPDNQSFKLSYQYYRNALAYAEAELPYMGLEELDKSDSILLVFYNGEYREAVEGDLVRNYWLRGAIYDTEDDVDKAKELYSNAITCADNAIDQTSVAYWAVISISSMLELLSEDPTSNASQIKVLKQKLDKYSRLMPE